MAPSPWGNAPNSCDRAAHDSDSADTDQVRGCPSPPGRWDNERVEIAPEDLRIDVARMVGVGPCGVRFTHTPTGMSVSVDDLVSTEANRDLAMSRLLAKLSESEA